MGFSGVLITMVKSVFQMVAEYDSIVIGVIQKEVRAICSANSDRKRRWRLHTQTTHPLSSAPKQLRLNPHHEGTSSCDKLLEDELIVRAPKRWHFGIDDSGDITKDDPAGQEVTTLPLLTAEFMTALRLLKDKGSLIIKVYTLYTQQTRALLSDVLRRFDDVYMFKPMSSKGGNNERYLICLRFRRAHSSVMDSELANKVIFGDLYFFGIPAEEVFQVTFHKLFVYVRYFEG
ncbi:unnamed protein product [Nippostrongylus brasiliensis]|uniref:Cap-specific mRNA (nucleoside-2'-O-)-methyltransferase 2 (inferred by orthology to a human protein) n=1 Tax=Nippostrongylus brasiliensis TaxID=27835 RepID=A0A0N4Y7V5_NIPBR|nr:unnamed protein product [Nippostrongylus brasiliensis]